MKTMYSPFVIMHDRSKESHGVPGSVQYDLEELESVIIHDIQSPSPALSSWEKTMMHRGDMKEDVAGALASLEELAVQDLEAKSFALKNRLWITAGRKMAALLDSADTRFSHSITSHLPYRHEPAA